MPNSLRDEIKEAATSFLRATPGGVARPADSIERVIAELIRDRPELFALLVLGNSTYAGIEMVEIEESTVDTVVELHNRNTTREVVPLKDKRTTTRRISFLSGTDSQRKR